NIYEIWIASGRTYGSDRGVAAITSRRHRRGPQEGRAADARPGLAGAFLRRGWRKGSTRQDPEAAPAPDLVNRNFTAAAPNRLWVADATRIPCAEGSFWLAAVRDVFSNHRRLEELRPLRHRPGPRRARVRDLVARCPRRTAHSSQRELHVVPVHDPLVG